jgi:hypothetical protein
VIAGAGRRVRELLVDDDFVVARAQPTADAQ